MHFFRGNFSVFNSNSEMKSNYTSTPTSVIKGQNRDIHVFEMASTKGVNIDEDVVKSFGEEWSKFNDFDDQELVKLGDMYFDIVGDDILNKNSYCMDVGCGTGRWSKILLPRIGFMESVDPSEAIFAADKVLGKAENVRLTRASTNNLPFKDETFDFAMSIGVLHHIPDTQKAMTDCVKKVKMGGHFYTYLYYKLDEASAIKKILLFFVTALRFVVSRMPGPIKKFMCDILAIVIYMPLVLLGRFFRAIGLKGLAKSLPLSFYQDTSFFVVRNDSLDRFGTTLEQRFSRAEITKMMNNAGLENVVISDIEPYWHAVGKRVR